MLELLKNYVDEQELHLYEDNAIDDLFDEPLSDDYVEKLREIIKKQKHLIERLCDAIEKLQVTFFFLSCTFPKSHTNR